MGLMDDIKVCWFGAAPAKKSTQSRQIPEYIVRDDAEKAMRTVDSASATREQKQTANQYLNYAKTRGVKV